MDLCKPTVVNPLGRRVVIVHDYLTQRGGAERVALDLLRAFPGSRLVTSVWDPAGTFPEFADHDIETLWLQRVGLLRRDPRRAFPLLARAFRKHTIDDADVVICSSSGWAHRVGTRAPKVVYCHNPARWLYQPEDYFGDMPPWLRRRFVGMTGGLRRSDAAAARSAARYLVNSTVVAERVRGTYGIEPHVLPPARGLAPDGPVEPVAGIAPGFLLTIARARGYKHTETVCAAVAATPDERLVVVGGAPLVATAPNVVRLADLNDAQMRWLYRNADSLVAVAHEDFGLTAVEAQSFGLPSVLLRLGGYLDTALENVTTVFVDDSTTGGVVDGIRTLRARNWDRALVRRCGERYSADVFADRVHGVVHDLLGGAASREPSFAMPRDELALHRTSGVQVLEPVRTDVELSQDDETEKIA